MGEEMREERDKKVAEDIIRRASPFWAEAIMKTARPDLSDAEIKEKIAKIRLGIGIMSTRR